MIREYLESWRPVTDSLTREESLGWNVHTLIKNVSYRLGIPEVYDFVVDKTTDLCLAGVLLMNAYNDSNLSYRLRELADRYGKDE